MTDEIMREVHAVKDAIGARYGHDIKALLEAIKRGEEQLRASGATLVAPPANPAERPASALQRHRIPRE